MSLQRQVCCTIDLSTLMSKVWSVVHRISEQPLDEHVLGCTPRKRDMYAEDTCLSACTRGRATNQAITQGVELHEVHDLIHKGSDDLSGLPPGPQLGAEQQGLPDSRLGRVHIKLLHVAAYTGECGLLFWVAVHADVALDHAACKVRYTRLAECFLNCLDDLYIENSTAKTLQTIECFEKLEAQHKPGFLTS